MSGMGNAVPNYALIAAEVAPARLERCRECGILYDETELSEDGFCPGCHEVYERDRAYEQFTDLEDA